MKPVTGIVVACLALLLCFGVTSQANAFGLSSAGVRLGATDPEGGDASLSGGGHLEFEELGSRFHLQPSVLFWSNDGLSDVNPNFDVYYHFERAGRVSPYLGAGAAVHMYSAEGPDPGTDMGLNMFGGVQVPTGGASRLFGEFRYSASDINQTSFFGGFTFPLSH